MAFKAGQLRQYLFGAQQAYDLSGRSQQALHGTQKQLSDLKTNRKFHVYSYVYANE